MKRKIIYTLITLALIMGAFFIGKMQSETPSKFNYLDLNAVTDTQIENNEKVIITTDSGDYYSFELK